MKHILIILAMVFTVSVAAQRQVEKSMTVSGNQDIFLNFKFAENITIKQWDKSEVLVKVNVNIDDGEGNDFFSLETETSGGTAEMTSEFGDYYKNKNRKYRNYRNYVTTTEILYTVYVPINANLKIKSISGDVESASFNGNLKTDLVSGDVTIKSYKGELWLKTVSGDLDVTLVNAEVNAKTLTGTIYSNIDIKTTDGKTSSGYNKIQTTINKGGKLVKMETVSGDVFLRKG
jgi:hypothetical protein